ncbi:hypothetical protein MKEN_00965100 [Mycena kentingensis (nom. inval.)]|nr:hypothetical protein MKEN_00965100 [Mycena kentingensis (nom. inval.)]
MSLAPHLPAIQQARFIRLVRDVRETTHTSKHNQDEFLVTKLLRALEYQCYTDAFLDNPLLLEAVYELHALVKRIALPSASLRLLIGCLDGWINTLNYYAHKRGSRPSIKKPRLPSIPEDDEDPPAPSAPSQPSSSDDGHVEPEFSPTPVPPSPKPSPAFKEARVKVEPAPVAIPPPAATLPKLSPLSVSNPRVKSERAPASTLPPLVSTPHIPKLELPSPQLHFEYPAPQSIVAIPVGRLSPIKNEPEDGPKTADIPLLPSFESDDEPVTKPEPIFPVSATRSTIHRLLNPEPAPSSTATAPVPMDLDTARPGGAAAPATVAAVPPVWGTPRTERAVAPAPARAPSATSPPLHARRARPALSVITEEPSPATPSVDWRRLEAQAKSNEHAHSELRTRAQHQAPKPTAAPSEHSYPAPLPYIPFPTPPTSNTNTIVPPFTTIPLPGRGNPRKRTQSELSPLNRGPATRPRLDLPKEAPRLCLVNTPPPRTSSGFGWQLLLPPEASLRRGIAYYDAQISRMYADRHFIEWQLRTLTGDPRRIVFGSLNPRVALGRTRRYCM